MSSAVVLPQGTLAELTDHLQALFDTLEMIDDADLRKQAEAEIDRYLQAEVRKVDNIADYIGKCEREMANLKAEAERLRQRAETWENRGQRVRDYVKRVMQQSETLRLEGRANTFYLRAATPSVMISDETLIPEPFRVPIVSYKIDKVAIKKAIEAGQDVPGADLALGGQSLVRR